MTTFVALEFVSPALIKKSDTTSDGYTLDTTSQNHEYMNNCENIYSVHTLYFSTRKKLC